MEFKGFGLPILEPDLRGIEGAFLSRFIMMASLLSWPRARLEPL